MGVIGNIYQMGFFDLSIFLLEISTTVRGELPTWKGIKLIIRGFLL